MLNLHFIHGFLGFASDWDIFKTSFYPNHMVNHSIEDYLPHNAQQNHFTHWALEFNKKVFQETTRLDPAVEPRDDNRGCGQFKNILIGYSLGGRLALHCLLTPNKWDGAIIISANPGLGSEKERKERIKTDETWGNRFKNEPWDAVMNAWNSQGVFSGQTNHLNRKEPQGLPHYRNNIYRILTGFSLGKQENLRYLLKNITIPVLWISGELDTKFSLIGTEMATINPHIESKIISNAGHRVPWESPCNFAKICKNFFVRFD